MGELFVKTIQRPNPEGSFFIYIPRKLADALRLEKNDKVVMQVEDNKLMVKKLLMEEF